MDNNVDLQKVNKSIKNLEERISRLEALITDSHPERIVPISNQESAKPKVVRGEEGAIEHRIGEFGMAWLGNFVLFFGIIFLIQFIKNQELSFFSSLFGYLAVISIYFLGHFLRKVNPYMSKLFSYNAHILLFVVTLQLHFTGSNPLLNSKFLAIFLLILVIAFLVYLVFRKRSQVLAGIVMVMTLITAIVSNSTHIMLPLMIAIVVLSIILLHKFAWRNVLFLSIFLVYTTFLLWFFNNPIITHSLQAVESLEFAYVYLFICALLYSILAIIPIKNALNENQVNVTIILNGLGFSALLALVSITFFKDNYYLILGTVSAVSITYSALLQSKGILKLSAALYALYGFALLSVTIGGLFTFPLAYLLLSIQSLLVVSMALWFRSRFIVAMNLVLFLGLLFAYLLSSSSINGIDISFALVALGTARVINWRKERLEIKTEWIRNLYLIAGFVMTLVSLYRTVPQNYITFSWAVAAGAFFVISLLLRNIKYRWLAISSMIFAVVYFFLIDLRQVSIGYRVIALLVLAAISLSFSMYYAKRMRKKQEHEEEAGK
ncbi:hypothetical protein ACFLRQ_01320 [Bacteroidota bacterium]